MSSASIEDEMELSRTTYLLRPLLIDIIAATTCHESGGAVGVVHCMNAHGHHVVAQRTQGALFHRLSWTALATLASL